MSEESCGCGNTEYEFSRYANVWQLICINCGDVIVPLVNDNVKLDMEIALENTYEDIKKNYPEQSIKLSSIKLSLEDMAYRVKNR